MLKRMMSKVIKDTHASGRESMGMILSERLDAVNEMTRHGGFAPAQCVLSRLPRNTATMGDEDECLDVGALQAYADGPTTFGVQSHYQQKHAKLSCDATVVNESDAPLCERPHLWLDPTKAGEHGLQWSVGSRLIGFEKDRNSLGETQPRTCWVIWDSVPVCVAVDRLRPCTPAELLAFHCTQTKSSSLLATETQIQQGFIEGDYFLNGKNCQCNWWLRWTAIGQDGWHTQLWKALLGALVTNSSIRCIELRRS